MKEGMDMARRLSVQLFRGISCIGILVGMNLLGCAGTTAVQRQHHLLLDTSSTASVYLLRPKEGFIMGVRGKPIVIDLDGENLLSLSIGEYTMLHLRRGKYGMKVTNTTLEGPDNAVVETSRDFILDLAEQDSVYLLFTLEKSNFWDMFSQKFAEQAAASAQKIGEPFDTLTVPTGNHGSLSFVSVSSSRLSSQDKHQPGIGYKVDSVSREAAMELASKLEPVEGAQKSPLHR